jgi:hypothetical protein
MPVSTDSEKNSSHGKKGKHLFTGLGTCVPPTLDACVDTFGKVIKFGDVKPCNIFRVEIRFRECVDNGVTGFIRSGLSSTLHSKLDINLMGKLVNYLFVHFILEDVNIFRGDPSF